MRRLLEQARVARLATLNPDGTIALVPFVFAVAGDTLYSEVDDKPKSGRRLQRLRNIERDPRVSVLVDHYEEDWDAVWWIRLRGRGRILPEGAERDAALRMLAARYHQYARGGPAGEVIAIDVTHWLGWPRTYPR